MTQLIAVRNRQRTRTVRHAPLRRMLRVCLTDCLQIPEFELALHLVGHDEMTRLNREFLNHRGSTDVITFDHATLEASPAGDYPPNRGARRTDPPKRRKKVPALPPPKLHGEIFVCVDEAVRQAPRYGASWETELIRYALHGLLHLCGYTDATGALRRQMRRREDELLRALSRPFPTSQITRPPAHG
jgi:probable rRNA maturation factor